MKTIDSTTAKKKFAELRKINPKSYVSNYCLNSLAEEILCFENENAIIILTPDRHIHRLFFAYLDVTYFEKLLCELPDNLQISLEIVTKDVVDEELKCVLDKHLLYDTTYIRSTCKLENIRNVKITSEDGICFAVQQDIASVERILNDTFSHHSSHLPNRKELEEVVQKNQLIVLKHNKVLGLVLFKQSRLVVNFDQLVNLDTNAGSTFALLSFFYSHLKNLNIEECFIWVDIENNKKVQKLHEYYGYKPDGVKNVIYVNNLLQSKLVGRIGGK